MMRTTRFAAVVWYVLAGFYLLFAGQISITEAIAGVIATLSATGFALALHGARSRRLRLRAPWPWMIAHPLAALFPDAVLVGGVLLCALWRRPAGAVGTIVCQPIRHDDGAAGRRALVLLGLSLAPNGYVVDRAGGQDALLLHRLAPTPRDRDGEWPA